MREKIYLSGPDRLKGNARELFEAKRQLCEKYGFELLMYPEELFAAKDSPENSERIARQRLQLIRDCDILIADTSDFRSFVEPYSESAFELGIGYGLEKRLYSYMPDARTCAQRYSGEKKYKEGYGETDADGIGFEPGPLNLMLEYGSEVIEGDLETVLKKIREGESDVH